MRIITPRHLREYAALHPQAEPSLDHWEVLLTDARWRTPTAMRQTIGSVDPVKVASGRTVWVFNIQGNHHRLIAAIHFNMQMVFVLKIMTHAYYDTAAWKAEL